MAKPQRQYKLRNRSDAELRQLELRAAQLAVGKNPDALPDLSRMRWPERLIWVGVGVAGTLLWQHFL